MIDPKRAARQLQDLADWAPLLTDTTAVLASPRTTPTLAHTRGTHRDLGDLLAPTIDAEDEGAYAIRTHAQIVRWATAWANVAELHYTGNPLHALANNTQPLASEWDDWDAFTEDLAILHTRIARLTGHAPRTIGPCPTPGCDDTITQAQTHHGAEGPLECPRGHTYKDTEDYIEATKASDRNIVQTITDPTIRVTISQFLHAWPELTKDDIKNWTRTGRLALTNSHPQTLNLAVANLLARRLVEGREKRCSPNKLAKRQGGDVE